MLTVPLTLQGGGIEHTGGYALWFAEGTADCALEVGDPMDPGGLLTLTLTLGPTLSRTLTLTLTRTLTLTLTRTRARTSATLARVE